MLTTQTLRKFVHDISNSLMHLGGKITLLKMDPSTVTEQVLSELEQTATSASSSIRELREQVRQLQMADPLIQLTYISEARVPSTEVENVLGDIQATATPFNKAHDISGFLIYRNGFFFQRIEGHKRNIEALYLKICKDVRHKSITLISCEEILERSFNQWDKMYSVSLDESAGDEVLTLVQSLIDGDKPNISNSESLVLTNHIIERLELA